MHCFVAVVCKREVDIKSRQSQHHELRGMSQPFSRRHDVETEKIINQAVQFQERLSTDFAAAYLRNKSISMDIAIRVLSRPGERRRY